MRKSEKRQMILQYLKETANGRPQVLNTIYENVKQLFPSVEFSDVVHVVNEAVKKDQMHIKYGNAYLYLPKKMARKRKADDRGDQGHDYIYGGQEKLLSIDGTLPSSYKVKSNPKGYGLVINNIDFGIWDTRHGAEKDGVDLVALLKNFDFQVDYVKDTTSESMLNTMEGFARRDWSRVDSCFVAVMSHGTDGTSIEETRIIGVDGSQTTCHSILSIFNNQNSPGLRNKPKIFIFHCCRGAGRDPGVIIESDKIGKKASSRKRRPKRPESMKMRLFSDMLVAYAVPPGVVAVRNTLTGAWFIQAIVKVFSEHAGEKEISDLFKLVDVELEDKHEEMSFQTVTLHYIGWNKRFFFRPQGFQGGDLPARKRRKTLLS